MNTIDERDKAVRALLLDSARRPEPRRRRITVLIAAVAFLLGAGLATGAVSAAVAATSAPVPIALPANAIADMLYGGHTLGPLLTYVGSGSARLDLGPRPRGATDIVWFVECGEGRGQVLGTSVGGKTDSGKNNCRDGAGFGSFTEQNPTDNIVAIKTDGKFTYGVWAQWYATPPPVEPSAAQKAELADGKVTSAELHAAVDRYLACMTGAGYTLSVTNYDPLSFSGTGQTDIPSGGDRLCYDTEIQQVDNLWVKEHK